MAEGNGTEARIATLEREMGEVRDWQRRHADYHGDGDREKASRTLGMVSDLATLRADVASIKWGLGAVFVAVLGTSVRVWLGGG